jgi:hypothetical protein
MSTTKRIVLVAGITLLGILAISALHRVNAVELNEEDFVPLATQGFLTAIDGPHPEGSRRNSYIWSMRWWQDKLYVGTARDFVCITSESLGFDPTGFGFDCPPPGTLTPDQRAEIWQYTPGGEGGSHGTWQRVFQSPLLLSELSQDIDLTQIPDLDQLPDVTQIPRDIGYRNMVDCDAGGESLLYTASFGIGGRLLYTRDGTTFQPASILGLDLVHNLGYRAGVCWKGRLWISPAGSLSITGTPPDVAIHIVADNAFRPVLLVNDDPSNRLSPWLEVLDVASDPQLGNPGNVGIYSMAVFDDALYVGVANQTTGFELWKADGAHCDRPPGACVLTWQKLIENGGGRPVPEGETPNNARIFSFAVFNHSLYWGASESGLFKLTTAELGRIGPNDRWDLIVGEPRDARAMAAYPNFHCQRADASCVPLSGMGPGFGPDPLTPGFANYIWSLAAHDGSLYAATFDASSFAIPGTVPIPGAVPGFDLWRSRNGTSWSLVSNDGFGNACNYGGRNLTSTPLGLFVGTANPFTTDEAVGNFCPGGTGGAEVWLGVGDPD